MSVVLSEIELSPRTKFHCHLVLLQNNDTAPLYKVSNRLAAHRDTVIRTIMIWFVPVENVRNIAHDAQFAGIILPYTGPIEHQ